MRANRASSTISAYNVVLLLLVVAAFFGVRIANSSSLVTNDEPFWLGRSANFSRAITHRDFEHTYQMAHPGVPVMWAGAFAFWIYAPDYAVPDPGNTEYPFFIDHRLTHTGIDPISNLQHARIIKLSLETIIFAIAVALIAMISSVRIATLTGLLIALDPFLAGFGPLLHVDSLFALAMFAASLAMALMFEGGRRWSCVLAGVLAATAVLTRTTGLVIAIPLAVGALLAWKDTKSTDESDRSGVVNQLAIWSLSFAITYVGMWPAVWVSPVSTVRKMVEWTLGAASGGHEHALFFAGEIWRDDPGVLFYPVTLLWRTTPIVWVGIALFVLSLLSEKVRQRVRTFFPVVVIGLSILHVMTLGEKKFDRYLLPAYPVISLLAAIGFDFLIESIKYGFPKFRSKAAPVLFTIIILGSTYSFVRADKYTLNYYNEIMHIFAEPEQSIQIGWGEGGSDVIEFLERQSQQLGRPVVVQTFSIPRERVPPPLKYFTIEDAVPNDSVVFHNVGLTTPDDWESTDFYLFNTQQTQRGMVLEYEMFTDAEPVFTVELGGVTIWEVYAPNQLPTPTQLLD